MKIDIQSMQTEGLAEALDVLGKAFATMSSSTTIYKGRSTSDIERRMQIVFGALLKHTPGQLYVAKQNGRVVGSMRMVEWPGCQMKPLQGLKVLPALMRAGGLGEMRRAMKMRGTWAKRDPKKPHWHLEAIGVTPELQGQGIGSKLMEYYCNHVDELGMTAYHETDSRTENVRFYERFGFRVVGEETIMDFPVWYLWRPARNEAS